MNTILVTVERTPAYLSTWLRYEVTIQAEPDLLALIRSLEYAFEQKSERIIGYRGRWDISSQDSKAISWDEELDAIAPDFDQTRFEEYCEDHGQDAGTKLLNNIHMKALDQAVSILLNELSTVVDLDTIELHVINRERFELKP